MAHAEHLRSKALRLRTESGLTIDQIAERLAISRSTIYSWVRSEPVPEALASRRQKPSQLKGTRAMQRKYRLLREGAYRDAQDRYASLVERDRTFRDFICMYIGEGYKRDRNAVAIANSDEAVVRLGHRWITRLADNPVRLALQFHADQDPDDLKRFWGQALDVEDNSITFQRKSNSGQLRGRHWRSQHGVLTVRASDTLLRARLQAWMDRVRSEWG